MLIRSFGLTTVVLFGVACGQGTIGALPSGPSHSGGAAGASGASAVAGSGGLAGSHSAVNESGGDGNVAQSGGSSAVGGEATTGGDGSTGTAGSGGVTAPAAQRHTVAFKPGAFHLQAGERFMVSDVAIELSATADFRALDGTGSLLWHSGTDTDCGSAECRIDFQNDGNLVLAQDKNPIWQSATWSRPRATLILASQPPYVTIADDDQTELWSSWELPDIDPNLGPPPLDARRGSGYDYITRGATRFTLQSGERLELSGASLRFGSDGILQLLTSAGEVLWSVGAAADCGAAGACSVTFDETGNLVLRAGGNVSWSSSLANNAGGFVTIANREPYVTIHDASYARRWTSSGGAESASPARAQSVQRFVDSLGVNVHMTRYESDVTLVANKLNYLGLRWIRDGFSANYSLKRAYQILADAGIHINLLLGGEDQFGNLMAIAETVKGLGPSFLGSVEGPNEINNFPFHCDGNTWQKGWPNDNGPAAVCYASKFYNAVLNTPELAGVDVFSLTGGDSAREAEALGLLEPKDKADYGNIHPYPKQGEQPLPTIIRNLQEGFREVTPEHAVITEIGYTGDDVSNRAQAIMVVNACLDAFQRGFHQTFVYELTDNSGERFGLFDIDDQPKPAADAIHNLLAILHDAGSGKEPSSTLKYSLTGFAGREILLQKSSGTFELLLWEEPAVVVDGKDVMPASKTVHLELDGARPGVRLFDPYSGPIAVKQWKQTASLDFTIEDHAVVVEIER